MKFLAFSIIIAAVSGAACQHQRPRAAAGIYSPNADCSAIRASLTASSRDRSKLISAEELKRHFTFIKDIAGGASGAATLLVEDKESGNKVFLKVLSDQEIDEIVWSCQLSDLSFGSYSAAPSPTQSVTFFGYGRTVSKNPFVDEEQKSSRPFMVIEFLDGFETMAGSMGFHPFDNERFHALDPITTKSYLLQVLLFLHGARDKFDFRHRDLHFLNIGSSGTHVDQQVVATPFGSFTLAGPIVKVIDFGRSSTEVGNQRDSMYWRGFNSSLNSSAGWPTGSKAVHEAFEKKYGTLAAEEDLAAFNTLLRSLYKSKSIAKTLTKEFDFCFTYASCFDHPFFDEIRQKHSG